MKPTTPRVIDETVWRALPNRFAQWMTSDRESSLRFRNLPHVDFIGRVVARTIARGRGRLIINLPPQHGKSWFLSRWVPTWFLEHRPDKRVIMASYSQDLIRGHSRFVRNEFLREDSKLSCRLSPDSQAVNRWNTRAGGGLYATTIGGQISGFSGDLILVDDPYKGWKEAWSTTVRRSVENWFNAELYTRRQQQTTIIVLHTRWHPDDLTGYLLKKHADDWTLLRLPAIAEENDPMSRAVGEALCDQLHPLEDLMAGRSSQAIWDAVYQQDPRGLGDSLVYKHFSDRNVEPALELVDGLPLHLSMDFNVRPGMHAIIGQHLPAEDMLTAVDELHGPGWDVRRVMQAFEQWIEEHDGRRRFPEVHIFGDSSGNARTMTTSESCYDLVVAMLRRMDLAHRIRVPRRAPAVRDSVDDFNEALRDIDGRIHYRVHPRCSRLLVDLQTLPPDEHGAPDKTDPDLSHASDAERYRITRLRPIPRAGRAEALHVVATS